MDINKEIEQMADKMEDVSSSSDSAFEILKSTIQELGPEALRKAVPTLTADQQELLKSVLEDLAKGKTGEGSRGGKVIGHTRSGKPIYADGSNSQNYTAHDHFDAEDHHDTAADKIGHLGDQAQRNAHHKQKQEHWKARQSLSEKEKNQALDEQTSDAYLEAKHSNTSVKKSEEESTDMQKSKTDLEPAVNSTPDGDEKFNEKKPHQTDADEKLSEEAKKKDQQEVRHQGGTPVEGWEGQVIKSAELPEGFEFTDDINEAYLGNDFEEIDFEDIMEKAGKSGEGSRGGKIVGHTKSGKPIYEGSKAADRQKKKMFADKINPDASDKQKAEARAMRNSRYNSTPDGEHKRYFKFQREGGAIPGKKGDKVSGVPKDSHKEHGVHTGGSKDSRDGSAGRSAAGVNAEWAKRHKDKAEAHRAAGDDRKATMAETASGWAKDKAKELHTKKLEEMRSMPKPNLTKSDAPEQMGEAQVKQPSLEEKKKMAKENLYKMMKRMQERNMDKTACVSKLAKSLGAEESKVGEVWDLVAKSDAKVSTPEAGQSDVPAQMKDTKKVKAKEALSGDVIVDADEAAKLVPSTMKKSDGYFFEEEVMYFAKSESNPFATRTIKPNAVYNVDAMIEEQANSQSARLAKSTFDYSDDSEVLVKSEDPATQQVLDANRKKASDDKKAKTEEIKDIKIQEKLSRIESKAGPKMPMLKSLTTELIEKNLDMGSDQVEVAKANKASQAQGAFVVKSFSDADMEDTFKKNDIWTEKK